MNNIMIEQCLCPQGHTYHKSVSMPKHSSKSPDALITLHKLVARHKFQLFAASIFSYICMPEDGKQIIDPLIMSVV